MECPISITHLLTTSDGLSDKWSNLSVLLSGTINLLEQSLMSSNLKQLSLDIKEDYLFSCDRETEVEKTKLSVINETLNSLKLIHDNFVNWNSIVLKSMFLYYGRDIDAKLKEQTQQLLNNFVDTFDSLNKNAKSPYDLEAILDPDYFKQSLKANPTNNIFERANSFIKLVENELGIIKESSKTNEMQKVILKCYLDKLKTLQDQINLSSATATSEKKSKSSRSNAINRICEIMKKCQRLIKDVYGLMRISTFKDNFDENNAIFNVINEKGCDAISDVCEFIESKKSDWIKRACENATQSTCRSSALRRLNVVLKLSKKLILLKDDLESSCIILMLKYLATDALQIDVAFGNAYCNAYYLTFKMLPKPRVDVPQNFVRDDPVYQEIHEKPHNGLFIVFIHILKYYKYSESMDWNPFQYRKPWELKSYLCDIQRLIEGLLSSSLTPEESYKISLDLADRYLMTKQKIHYDRETLAFRFDLFKPIKPYKFPEICKILHSQFDDYKKRWKLRDQMVEKFDDLINRLNRKVTNRGQLIVFERAMAMMKRSIYLFKIIRSDELRPNDGHLHIKLIEQAANEYMYAAEIVVKLLDSLKPNRRITFSFSANGPFTNKIDKLGLNMKDEFMEKVNSQIKTLKIEIKDKEADLESMKSEKTQLKYLQSISNRIKLIPIKELEMTDEDNIVILREIVEEYEFTIIKYGPVAIT